MSNRPAHNTDGSTLDGIVLVFFGTVVLALGFGAGWIAREHSLSVKFDYQSAPLIKNQ